MQAWAALSLLCLCLLVRIARPSVTIASPIIAQTRSSSSSLGEKPAKLCVLYNFPAGGSLVLEELAVQGGGSGNEAVLVVNAESPVDLQHVGGFDVAVGFVRASQALLEDGELSLLTSLVALLEGLYRAAGPSTAWNGNRRLVFFVDGIDKEQEALRFAKICKRLQAVAEEAAGLVFPGGAPVEVHVVCRAEDVAAVVAQAGAGLTGAQIAANMERAVPTSSIAPAAAAGARGGDVSAAEQQAAAACMGLAEDLVAEVSAGVASLGAGLLMDDVGAVVGAATERLVRSEAAEALHASYARTDALKFAVYRTKTQLVRALHAPFARLLDARIEASQRAFRAAARKVPTDPQMRSGLERLARAVVADARQGAASLQAGFVAMADLPREGIFSVPAYQRVHASECFSCAAAVSRLQHDLQEQCVETVRQAFLAGTYNPYVRDRPWAPTHINLNYLVDPRALALGLDYNPLYDEHVEGPAVSRAEPLLLKGVAEVAFDANDQPVAPPGKKWWKVLLDYYQP